MRTRTRLAGLFDAQVGILLRRWERFKITHPEHARRLSPLMRNLWRIAVRRRTHWAGLRPIPLVGVRDPAAAAVAAGNQVDEQHMVKESSARIAARVEYVFLVPDKGVLLAGWICDPQHQVTSVKVRTSTFESDDILGTMSRLARPDVIEAFRSWLDGGSRGLPGFACFVSMPDVPAEEVMASLVLELYAEGRSWSLEPRPIIAGNGEPLATIRNLLAVVPPRDAEILQRHVGPAVSGLWHATREDPTVVEVGTPPADPRVSIIIPVYGRYDLIEYQLALFANDPDMLEAELIYVVDDPRITTEAAALIRSTHPIFRVPARVVLCARNHGFAGATNMGASIARGELLLLLNSDVMPRSPGWVSELAAAYSKLARPGAIAPRLLFPDGSVQHAGMSFVQAPWLPGLWLNDHPGKGLPPSRIAATEPVRVPAVTGACLMISRALYHEVGGLDEGYIVGDFEDSDLCLKLLELGRHSWVAPWIELYHVERMSQSLTGEPGWRQSITLYNAWRHTNRWARLLRTMEVKTVDA